MQSAPHLRAGDTLPAAPLYTTLPTRNPIHPEQREDYVKPRILTGRDDYVSLTIGTLMDAHKFIEINAIFPEHKALADKLRDILEGR